MGSHVTIVPMRDFLHRLVQRLHDGERPLSRNRHFHAFLGEGRRALRIDKHLRDLESALLELQARGERPRVRRLEDGGARLVLRDTRMSLVRTATLSAEETAVLATHPAGAWALSLAEGADAADARPAAAVGRGGNS